MALILSIETSTEVCSVALANNGKLIDLEESKEGLNHSELLTSFIEIVLNRNNLTASNVDAFAVSKGPGSYTGLRIGVSAAKGICYSTGKPLIAISTLESMAKYFIQNPAEFEAAIDEKTLICPMIDARRMEVYYALYDSKGLVIEPVSAKIVTDTTFAPLIEKNKLVLLGNGAEKCMSVLNNGQFIYSELRKASARFMAEVAEEYFENKQFEDVAYFEPFYLKDFVATIPKNKVIK